MLNREKIIVLLMIAAVAYGGYSYLWTPKKNTAIGDPKKKLDELKTFVVDAATSLSSESVSSADRYIIEQAGENWSQNPFLQSGTLLTSQPFEAKADVTVEKIKLAYSGFLQISDSLLAIVNGMEYETGEQLNEAGYYIKHISPQRVVIGIEKSSKTIILPLDEDVSIPKKTKE